jgi:hypothetical protein
MSSLYKKLCKRCVIEFGCIWNGGDEYDWKRHLVWCPSVRNQTTKRTLTMKEEDFVHKLPDKGILKEAYIRGEWLLPPPNFCPFLLEQLLLLENA